MDIAFIGDVHGRACHALSVLLVWQSERRSPNQVVHEGCMGVLNTNDWTFEFVAGDWLGSYPREVGFDCLAETVDRLEKGSF